MVVIPNVFDTVLDDGKAYDVVAYIVHVVYGFHHKHVPDILNWTGLSSELKSPSFTWSGSWY